MFHCSLVIYFRLITFRHHPQIFVHILKFVVYYSVATTVAYQNSGSVILQMIVGMARMKQTRYAKVDTGSALNQSSAALMENVFLQDGVVIMKMTAAMAQMKKDVVVLHARMVRFSAHLVTV